MQVFNSYIDFEINLKVEDAMEIAVKIMLGSLLGTFLMTILSYLLSNIFNKQFREPVLLNKLLQRAKFAKKRTIHPLSGWAIHYMVGVALVIIYHFYWTLTFTMPHYINGSLLGLASGFLAVAWWSCVFKLHQNPPSIDFKMYYLQLVIVHIFFGIGATIGYTWI